MSLNKLLKADKVINTDLGEFEYIKSLGEGGNSYVFKFRKGESNFAIKFLKSTENSKLNRFKDEYFCAIQIPSHKNVAKSYHFDEVAVGQENYFIIIMKYYDGTLSSEGSIINEESEEVKSEKSWSLFVNLANSLLHLHKNGIIHRDLKPQNVFFDEDNDLYVIGDLGIAHFSDEKFERESKTKPSERMANYGFSAPEQIDSKSQIHATCDIYSLGQVLHWYLTGRTIRGLNMTPIANSDSPDKLRKIQSIISKCLDNDPSKRFQSILEIYDYHKKWENPPRPKKKDYWLMLDTFDDCIRRSVPKIKDVLEIQDVNIVNRFLRNFKEDCDFNDFWYMTSEGGDNTFTGIDHLSDSRYLFGNLTEIELSKLIIYRDQHYSYKNFFVLLLNPSEPFDVVDEDGNLIPRQLNGTSKSDIATLWNDNYIPYEETENGYYEYKGDVITVDRDSFQDRMRHLEKYAYIVVPNGTATACMNDRTPTTRFLQRILSASKIEEASLRTYQSETRSHHSREITMYD